MRHDVLCTFFLGVSMRSQPREVDYRTPHFIRRFCSFDTSRYHYVAPPTQYTAKDISLYFIKLGRVRDYNWHSVLDVIRNTVSR